MAKACWMIRVAVKVLSLESGGTRSDLEGSRCVEMEGVVLDVVVLVQVLINSPCWIEPAHD